MNIPLLSRLTLTILALTLLLLQPSSWASLIPASDFNDSAVWTPLTEGSATSAALQVIDNGFTVTVPPAVPFPYSAGYRTTFALQGDFTVDADFLLEQWPQINHMRIGVGFFSPPPQSAIERTSEGWGVDECYIFDGVGHGIVVTDDTSGSLRLSRTGSTLAGYYLNEHSEWILVGSGSVTTADAVICMTVWPDYTGGGGVKVTFRNPIISTEGYVPDSHTPVPEPSTYIAGVLLLLPFGIQSLQKLRK